MTRTLLLTENNVNNIIRQTIDFYLEDIEDLRCGVVALKDPAASVLDWAEVRHALLAADAGRLQGVAAVDNYFKKTANKLAESGNVRLFVMVSADQALIGFYAINAHAVEGPVPSQPPSSPRSAAMCSTRAIAFNLFHPTQTGFSCTSRPFANL